MRPIDVIAEELEAACVYLGEVNGQYQFEVGLYGDAGPGQGIEVRETRAYVRELKEEAAVARSLASLAFGWAPDPEAPPVDDIPF